jgi:hypothetical protein
MEQSGRPIALETTCRPTLLLSEQEKGIGFIDPRHATGQAFPVSKEPSGKANPDKIEASSIRSWVYRGSWRISGAYLYR